MGSVDNFTRCVGSRRKMYVQFVTVVTVCGRTKSQVLVCDLKFLACELKFLACERTRTFLKHLQRNRSTVWMTRGTKVYPLLRRTCKVVRFPKNVRKLASASEFKLWNRWSGRCCSPLGHKCRWQLVIRSEFSIFARHGLSWQRKSMTMAVVTSSKTTGVKQQSIRMSTNIR